MKLATPLTLLFLTTTTATAAAVVPLPLPNPSHPLQPRHHSTCHHLGKLTEYIRTLPDPATAGDALKMLHEADKVSDKLECPEGDEGDVGGDECKKAMQIKTWTEQYWYVPRAQWAGGRKAMLEECGELGAVVGCLSAV